MKYLLKKDEQDKGVLCDKVTIDGFDYYELNTTVNSGDFVINDLQLLQVNQSTCVFYDKKVMATSNPNIDLPKVVDESISMQLAYKHTENLRLTNNERTQRWFGYIEGYNKSQSTHQYSEQNMLDLIQSLKDYTAESNNILGHDEREPVEFLNIFKDNQPKVIYYHD